jgi:6,7-dimethyl-8-ribityllumazine synthase
MAVWEGQLRAVGKVAVVVSRYHERLTLRLLEGAEQVCRDAAVPEEWLDILWVPGAFELGVAVSAAARSGKYRAIVALGVVIRGETPHFDVVVDGAAATAARVASETLVPVGLGLLTCDNVEQAVARAGGDHGNKGAEAAEAALRTASMLDQAGIN